MSLYLIRADRIATLAADDPVIAASDVAPLRDAARLLAEAGKLHGEIESRIATVEAAAQAEGRAAGYAAGVAAAEAEAAAGLFDLTMRASSERTRLRGDVSRLALEVVRRIAERVGTSELVAGLAERAALDLLPDTVATVRVPAAAVEQATARLARWSGLTVIGDPAMADSDCLIETPLGVSHAGLEVQLAAVERAWAAPGADNAA